MVVREESEAPWSDVAIDILGPIKLKSRDHYVLVCVDMFSHWPEIKVVNSVVSSVVIEFLDSLFEREGVPKSLLSDNGVQFTSSVVEEFLSSRGIKHKKAAYYHLESNGVVERFVKVLKETLQQAVATGGDWEIAMKKKVKEYRFTPHSSTGVSPFQLFKKRAPCTEVCPSWVCSKRISVDKDAMGTDGWRDRERMVKEKRKQWYDLRKAVKNTKVFVGDWVKIKSPCLSKPGSKLSTPFKVIKLFKNAVLTHDHKVWNLNRVAKWRVDNS